MLDFHAKPFPVAVELHAYPDQTTLLVTPTGEMYQLSQHPDIVKNIFQLCDGQHTIAEIIGDSAEIAELIELFVETQCVAIEPAAGRTYISRRFVPTSKPIDETRIAQTHLVVTGQMAFVEQMLSMGFQQTFMEVAVAKVAELPQVLANKPGAFVVALYAYEDGAALEEIDQLCEEAGSVWVSLRLAQGLAWLGPLIIPDQTAHYRDLVWRRIAAADNQAVQQAVLGVPFGQESGAEGSSTPLLPREELGWLCALLFTEIARWLSGMPCRLVSSELCADPLMLTQTVYPLLPAPDHRLSFPLTISAPIDLRLLHNHRTGIITDFLVLHHHPSIPSVFKTYQARLAQNPDWLNDLLSMSSVCDLSASFDIVGEDESGFQSAQAIGIEQVPPQVLLNAAKYYCDSNFYHAEATLSTYRQLVDVGDYALDPQQLALYSPQMYAMPGCPFEPFTHDTLTYWVKGYSQSRGKSAWLPAHTVFVNSQLADFITEPVPLTQSQSYVGLAAGWSLEEALVSAIEDCIRRDAMMLWWFNKQPLPSIQPTPELAAIWAGLPSELGQDARLIYLPNQFGLPIIAGILENTLEKLLTIGFGYGPDPIQAALQAWAEAATSQEASRDMNDPNGLTRQSVEQGMMHDSFKPWLPDRAYLDAYRDDFKDMTDPLVQRQLYLDPRAIEQVRPWIDTPITLTFDDIPPMPERSLAYYQRRLAEQGFELFYFDLTPPDLAIFNMTVVRVVIPGLVPAFPAAFPAIGNGRVQHAAVELGWRTTPLADDELNYMPLPGA